MIAWSFPFALKKILSASGVEWLQSQMTSLYKSRRRRARPVTPFARWLNGDCPLYVCVIDFAPFATAIIPSWKVAPEWPIDTATLCALQYFVSASSGSCSGANVITLMSPSASFWYWINSSTCGGTIASGGCAPLYFISRYGPSK